MFELILGVIKNKMVSCKAGLVIATVIQTILLLVGETIQKQWKRYIYFIGSNLYHNGGAWGRSYWDKAAQWMPKPSDGWSSTILQSSSRILSWHKFSSLDDNLGRLPSQFCWWYCNWSIIFVKSWYRSQYIIGYIVSWSATWVWYVTWSCDVWWKIYFTYMDVVIWEMTALQQ